MPEFVISENGVDLVVEADKQPKGAVPVAKFLAALAKDEDLAGIIPEATEVEEPAKAEPKKAEPKKAAAKKASKK